MATVLNLVVTIGTMVLLASGAADDPRPGANGHDLGANRTAQHDTAGGDMPTAVRDTVVADTVVTIEPVGNELKFATTEIRVRAGTTLKIVFKNTSTVFAHNLVVLNRAEDIDEVGEAAVTALEHGYVPPKHHDKLVAFTELASPGTTVEVSFTVPPPGEYPYVCTFPGHYVFMRGTLISEE